MVISFNLRHAWEDSGDCSWSSRRPLAADLLRRLSPDIIGLQEVNPKQVIDIEKILPDHQYLADRADHGPRWEYRPIMIGPGLAALEQETISLSETPDRPSRSWGSQFVRQATRVLIDSSAGPLAVYNTHLDFAEATRLHQAQVIIDQVLTRDADRPVIVMGDFNSRADDPVHRLLCGEPGRPGPFQDCAAWPQAFTYHGFTGRPMVGAIDWILTRGPVRVIEPARPIYFSQRGVFPSDHYPLRAVLEVDEG